MLQTAPLLLQNLDAERDSALESDEDRRDMLRRSVGAGRGLHLQYLTYHTKD
jgi:hypothetical protein